MDNSILGVSPAEKDRTLEAGEYADAIARLKKERRAVILAHLYQWPEVQDAADFVGDSLELSRKARDTDADMIVFCGVSFMAETAKILSPEKTVLLPEKYAGCPMADMITTEDLQKLKAEHPNAAVICYVNSSAEIKAASDICCTSSNAVRVAESVDAEEIIFIPDQNLGRYVAGLVPSKKFFFFQGYCPTHNRIKASDVRLARQARPDAPVLVHPECVPEVTALADYTGSTAQIIDYALHSDSREFIIGTEIGVLHRLEKLCPDKKFYSLSAAMVCPNMKKTTLRSLYDALLYGQYEITVEEGVRQKAAASLDRMLSVGSKPVRKD